MADDDEELGPPERAKWRDYADIAAIFAGPTGTRWATDRDAVDDELRDPEATAQRRRQLLNSAGGPDVADDEIMAGAWHARVDRRDMARARGAGAMMTWNYRTTVTREGDEEVFAIREVYYEAGKIVGWTENAVAPQGDSWPSLGDDLAKMQAAIAMPLLDLTGESPVERQRGAK